MARGTYDPALPDEAQWFPANDVTAVLASAVEACRSILRLLGALEPSAPTKDARGLTLLSVPVHALAVHTKKLVNLLAGHPRENWSTEDGNALVEQSRRLRKLSKDRGPLDEIRNKRGAHVDPRYLHSSSMPPIDARAALEPLGCALFLLVLLLNHERVFEWTSRPAPGRRRIFGQVETGTGARPPFAVEVSVDAASGPTLECVVVTDDPRKFAQTIVTQTIDAYNSVAATAWPPLAKITLRPL